jgi:hypothetical protein
MNGGMADQLQIKKVHKSSLVIAVLTLGLPGSADNNLENLELPNVPFANSKWCSECSKIQTSPNLYTPTQVGLLLPDIATSYGLDGPGIESRYAATFSAAVQTCPGTNPASCTMGTGSPSQG